MKNESAEIHSMNSEISPLLKAMVLMQESLRQFHTKIFSEREEDHFEVTFLNPQYRREESRTELHELCREVENLSTNKDGSRLKGLEKEVAIRLVLFRVSCSFFAKSMLALSRDEPDTAWENLLDSNFIYGQLCGRQSIKNLYHQSQTNLDKRHAENRSLKQDVFTWLDTNMKNYKSMDRAATAIAGKISPIEFRTARDWVGQWKKLRSTSTP